MDLIILTCPSCHKNDAIFDEYYGWLPCLECTRKQRTIKNPNKQIDMIPQRIKEDRKANFADAHPDHRKGTLSKEWLDRYGKDKAKARGYTDREIKKAKPVWNDDRWYNE